MAQQYQVIVHYHFKKGMEEKGVQFLERELIRHAQEMGCHRIELCQSERDPSELMGIGTWNSLDEARRFQSKWSEKEKELLNLCTGSPKRDVLRMRSTFMEKSRKAA